MAAVGVGIAALVLLLGSILERGLPAFTQTFIRAEIFLDPAVLDPSGNRDPEAIKKVLTFAYAPIIKASLSDLSAELQAERRARHHPGAARRAWSRRRRRRSSATTSSPTRSRSARRSSSSS